MNVNESQDENRLELVLVVPLGVEKGLFPWGMNSVKDYIQHSCNFVKIRTLDFRDNDFFIQLNKDYSKLLGEIFLGLKPDQINAFFGVTSNPYIFLGLLGKLGKDFAALAQIKLSQKCIEALIQLQGIFQEYLKQVIHQFVENSGNAQRVWAFSVYDYTLFNSLQIAELVRESDPHALIILGGDYFDFDSARETAKGIDFIDGVIVGYGEELMRKVLFSRFHGKPVTELREKSFFFKGSEEWNKEKHWLNSIDTPPFYYEFKTNPVISFVQNANENEIRIMSQRGCSWGKCIFCAQLDKNCFFPISPDDLLKKIREKLDKIVSMGDSSHIVRFIFDSDESSVEMVLQFIGLLEEFSNVNIRFEIVLWLQVKGFRRELADRLAKVDNQKIHIIFRLNFESLNFKTLTNMRKGHSPLKAIEAAKAILDCGQSFLTNYFTHYPLEDSVSIVQEADTFSKSLHLFMPPKGGISFYPYSSNNRDSVFKDQRKYKITSRHITDDIWMEAVYGIRAPFSIWAFDYDEDISPGFERLLAGLYHRGIKARNSIYRPLRIAQANWGSLNLGMRFKLSVLKRKLKFAGIMTFQKILHLTRRGRAYRQREQLFLYLSQVMDEAAKKESDGYLKKKFNQNARVISSRKISLQHSFCFIKGISLNKISSAPGNQTNWSLVLTEKELEVLRFLYWIRRRNDVIEKFGEEITAADAAGSLIEKFIKLGVIIQFKNMLLCVANDPDYWKLNLSGS